MKKFTIIIILLYSVSFGAAESFARDSLITLNFGTFNPKATDSGFIFGLKSSNVIDDYLELGISADYFTNKHTDETTVNVGTSGTGTRIAEKEVSIETETIYVPVMLGLTFKLPLDFRVTPYVGLNAGYVFLWDKYKNYEDNVEDKAYFDGFGWRIVVGSEIKLGSRSALTAEFFNSWAKPSRTKDPKDFLPIKEEVDMSGVGLYVGLRIYM